MERKNNFGSRPHHDNGSWNVIKEKLRTSYHHDDMHKVQPDNNNPKGFWNRFEELTGMSKEEFKEEVRRP
jgi:hypothetical protein